MDDELTEDVSVQSLDVNVSPALVIPRIKCQQSLCLISHPVTVTNQTLRFWLMRHLFGSPCDSPALVACAVARWTFSGTSECGVYPVLAWFGPKVFEASHIWCL